ncbi:UNVERIFIED_CONTAM: Transcription termination factor MT, chloroplastic [Sesamum radiatum]|uniref:Transcription termination factor MT, chloroplastic n=1 Tax=Sesamum radiatum TaxID=300843 RepID=A0AAW2JDT4_SESRA
MKVTSYAGLAKPSFLLVHYELPAFAFHRPQLVSISSLCVSRNYEENERIANRARVYEFLRGIGIVPDELDGLELPVTVDVMRERVEFLHKLGLTIEDINNYPLVLGCSVKKNMVPVLDYLGKLGVRKSTFTEFLRRYPQVLHASVCG